MLCNHGPVLACFFKDMTGIERRVWAETARISAILGGMKLSMRSFRSGLACYIAFVGEHVCGVWPAIVERSICARRDLPGDYELLAPSAERPAGMVSALPM